MLQSIEDIPDPIGNEAPFQRNRVERSERETGSNGREENVPDKGKIVTKGQDEYGFIELYHPVLKVEGCNQDHRKKIIADIGQGQKVGEPRGNPLFHPKGRMDPKKEEVDLDQPRINIRLEILDQVTEGFIDEDNEKDGRKLVQKCCHPPHPL
jgi:hypothetical protein